MKTETADTFRDFCKEQVSRFAGCPGWPSKEYPAAIRDLVDSLVSLSRSDRGFAQRLVDICKETGTFCPTVADLIRIAGELRTSRTYPDPRTRIGCEKCDWTGWRLIKGPKGEGSKRCECSSVKPAKPPEKRPARDFAQLAAGDRG